MPTGRSRGRFTRPWAREGGGYRELDLHPNEPHSRSGGSTDMDAVGHAQEANLHRFYKELAETTHRVTFGEGSKRLILAGPKERTAELRQTLPQELQELVVAEANVERKRRRPARTRRSRRAGEVLERGAKDRASARIFSGRLSVALVRASARRFDLYVARLGCLSIETSLQSML